MTDNKIQTFTIDLKSVTDFESLPYCLRNAAKHTMIRVRKDLRTHSGNYLAYFVTTPPLGASAITFTMWGRDQRHFESTISPADIGREDCFFITSTAVAQLEADHLRVKMEAFKQEADAIREELGRTKDSEASARNSKSLATQELQRLNQQYYDSLVKNRGVVREKDAEIAALTKELKEAKVARDSIHAKDANIETLRHWIRQDATRIDDLKKQVDDLKKQLSTVKLAKGATEIRFTASQQRAKALEEKVATLEGQVKDAVARLDKEKANHNATYNLFARESTRHGATARELQAEQNAVKRLREQLQATRPRFSTFY